ncbi:hypothetical protein SAMD00019534_114370 [Acytostelium subglobosum LB1]|uniref:hypothetical protein n=1 Tax=Acytostelium subglobosum LB1 TaxID=1410327 RepID=UPI00064488EF|nr:hypothetical protein SAMD00019534_114370 [Acytostelium subglobosum LB1]GAM28261.1 hypothetical protein SAMD00019534_114370 [Acytostelium subglobosum LB1]|eukprot:XP_012748895.1 hypothetical protein SAMD00019534_114370 [Acytostelium subglobosum LB1]
MNYDFNTLTTISLDYDDGVTIDPQLICYAHAKDVRVVIDVIFDAEVVNLGNFTWEQEYINTLLTMMQDNYLDGLNFDIEQSFSGMSSALFTAFLAQLTYQFKLVAPYCQISMDTTFSPDIGRNFDYTGLADSIDYIIMMDYDITNMINDPLPDILSGIQKFLDLQIPPNKLIAALPWYGFDNICTSKSIEDMNCDTVTDSVDIMLDGVLAIINDANITSTGEIWSDANTMPFINYIHPSDNRVHQAWYENPQSVAAKVAAIKPFNLGGIGVFQFETIVGTAVPASIQQQMWDATSSFLTK